MAAMASAQQEMPIPIDPAVKIGQLDNGLTYYIRHNEEPKGQANFYIAQKVGSCLEDENQRGLAHFLEHMCFNGTQHFPGNGVIQYCERIGVKFGENLNAYTGVDETVYNIDNVPVSAIPSAVDSCLWILHDWADGLLLTDDDIDHERGVIHEEWRTRSNAQMRQLEKFLPVIYPDGNRYGNRLPIGLMEVVDNFPYKDLRDYYEKWYRPDLQGIVVVGDIDVNEVESKIRTIFSTIDTPVNPAKREYFQIPDNKEPIVCITTDKEQPYALSYIYCKHDPYPMQMRSGINYYVYQVMMNAAALMAQARIDELTQSAEPPFIQAFVGDGAFFISSTKHAWQGQVISSESNMTEAVTALYREMLRAARCGFTASEFERAKAQIMATVEANYQARNNRKSADFCKEYVRYFIDNEPIPGIENEMALLQQIMPLLTVENVNAMMKALVNDNLVVICMLPDKEGVNYPSEKELAQMMADVEAEDIQPYVDQVSDEPLMSQLPAKGKVVKRKAAGMGYTEFTLSNGAKVYFRSTDFNDNEIVFSAVSWGGQSLLPDNEFPYAQKINDVMTVGGIGQFSTTELLKKLAGKKVSLTANISYLGEGTTGSSTKADLETMLQLNYLMFTQLREDQAAFESWKIREKAQLANQELDPMFALQDSAKHQLYARYQRLADMNAEQIDRIDYHHLMQTAAQRFANAADFKFIITGAVDEATLLPLIEQYIASLPAGGKKEKADIKTMAMNNNNVHCEFTRQMEVPMATNIFFYHSTAKSNLKNRLALDLATNALSVVLLEEIREKEGATYGIGAYGSMSGYPTRQSLMQISYQTDPARYKDMNQRVRDIVNDFVKNGPSEENLAKGKEFMLKQHNEQLRDNNYWTEAFEYLLDNGEDLTDNYEAVLKSITCDDARKAIADMLKKGYCKEIIMVGENNAAE